MDLIENHEFNISDEISAFIQHTSKNFSGHDKTASFRVDLDISCQNSNRRRGESLLEISEFLVREGFDRGRINRTTTDTLRFIISNQGDME